MVSENTRVLTNFDLTSSVSDVALAFVGKVQEKVRHCRRAAHAVGKSRIFVRGFGDVSGNSEFDSKPPLPDRVLLRTVILLPRTPDLEWNYYCQATLLPSHMTAETITSVQLLMSIYRCPLPSNQLAVTPSHLMME